MAKQIVETITDDLTGEPADDTVLFGLDGVTYTVDLTSENSKELREYLAQFVQVGRRVTSRVPSRPVSKRGRSRKSNDIRQWALNHGISVAPRGRIPASVTAAYNAQHDGAIAVIETTDNVPPPA